LRLTVNGQSLQVPLAGDAARRAAVKMLTKMFKAYPIPVRESLREQLRRAAGNPAVPRCILAWDELAEMQRLGMTIGAHTVTHPNLPNAGPVDAWREIEGSKVRLERELCVPVTMFAYPNGGAERYMTPKIALMVKSAGFAAAATSRNGFAGPQSDPFALERVEVQQRLEDLIFALEIERLAFAPMPRRFEQVGA
jgi:peptidoglycan/xylan/chitin deacetylase (PgdA/CDA1 family)